VFRFDEGLEVFLYRQPVDFRAGFNGLSILIEQALPFARSRRCSYSATGAAIASRYPSARAATASGWCPNDPKPTAPSGRTGTKRSSSASSSRIGCSTESTSPRFRMPAAILRADDNHRGREGGCTAAVTSPAGVLQRGEKFAPLRDQLSSIAKLVVSLTESATETA